MSKKLFAKFIVLALISVFLTGCGSSETADVDKLSIVTTVFPAYDFARQVCDDKAEVTMLLPPSSESHSYEPSPKDIIKIQNCDLFIYVGGESDSWIDKVLSSMDKPVKTVRMMDCVDVAEEEIVEGMEEVKTPDNEGIEYDEHIWTSPKNSVKITEAISEAVCGIDKENIDIYKTNTVAYIEKLNRLDKDFTDFFAAVENKVLIFGDRFPFRYFADAYGLEYYAAFPGCSAETEASAATIAFLIDKVKTENISTVFYIEFSNHKIADSVAEAANIKTALIHSCHDVSKADLTGGATYISMMEQNLLTLKEAMK